MIRYRISKRAKTICLSCVNSLKRGNHKQGRSKARQLIKSEYLTKKEIRALAKFYIRYQHFKTEALLRGGENFLEHVHSYFIKNSGSKRKKTK